MVDTIVTSGMTWERLGALTAEADALLVARQKATVADIVGRWSDLAADLPPDKRQLFLSLLRDSAESSARTIERALRYLKLVT